MRNTGWYIPYWRKPKPKKGKAEKPSTEDMTRSDEQLEAVRQRWIERYRRMARALAMLGLSVGSDRTDVQARYDALRREGGGVGALTPREFEDAYRYLLRVLPPVERRKRRSTDAGGAGGGRRATVAAPEPRDLTVEDERGTVVSIDVLSGIEISMTLDGEDEADPDEADPTEADPTEADSTEADSTEAEPDEEGSEGYHLALPLEGDERPPEDERAG